MNGRAARTRGRWVVILGMATVGGTGLSVLGPSVALVSFLVGAAAGGRVPRIAVEGWSRRCTGPLAGIGVVLAVARAGGSAGSGLRRAGRARPRPAAATTGSTTPPTGTAPSMACVGGGATRTADTSRTWY